MRSDGVRNCKETTKFITECEKIIESRKKGILNLAYKQGLLFEKFKKPEKFIETYRKWSK